MLAFFLSHGAEEDGMNMGWASAHPRAGRTRSLTETKSEEGAEIWKSQKLKS